jgi:RNA polymerase sigma-70 factor (ECF subfamily)
MDGSILSKTPAQAARSDAADLPEGEAIRLAQRGEERGFERLYRLHSQRVYALCLRMVKGNAAEAEDFTQESFLQLFRKIGSFRGESAFSTWLHRLTVNTVLMRLRRRRYQILSLDEMLEPGENNAELQEHIGTRDLRLSGSADRIDFEHAVQQLPPGYKEILILHDVQGHEHREIAAIRGCSVGNSKSQLHKARARLRQLLHRGVRYRDHHIVERMKPVLSAAPSV